MVAHTRTTRGDDVREKRFPASDRLEVQGRTIASQEDMMKRVREEKRSWAKGTGDHPKIVSRRPRWGSDNDPPNGLDGYAYSEPGDE